MEENSPVSEHQVTTTEKVVPKKSCMHRLGCVFLALLLIFGGFILFLVLGIGYAVKNSPDFNTVFAADFDEGFKEEIVKNPKAKNGKLVMIDISGIILNGESQYSDSANSAFLCKQLDKVIKDDDVAAVILNLNTPGGEVTAADDVYNKILEVKKSGRPVIALMNSMAASGGYYIAAACDKIVAGKLTLTGSIGVIISTYNYKGLLDMLGVKSEVYKSGKMKDMLNPARERTKEEIDAVQELVDDSYQEFVRIVSVGRKIPVEKIRDTIIGDGRVLHGAKAFELGLVDKIGRENEAVDLAYQLTACEKNSMTHVRYRKNTPFLDLLLGSFKAPALKLELPGIRTELPQGRLYYLPAGF